MDYVYSREIIEILDQTYREVEAMRSRLWDLILATRERLEEGDRLETLLYQVDECQIGESERVYRVTIFDYLPRNRQLERVPVIRRTWVKTATKAFQEIPERYEKLFLQFVIYLPNNTWDVDNRPIKYLIDGARYGGLVSDDDFKHLSYSVFGEIDQEYPRTEIYVFDGRYVREQALAWREKFPEVKIKPKPKSKLTPIDWKSWEDPSRDTCQEDFWKPPRV